MDPIDRSNMATKDDHNQVDTVAPTIAIASNLRPTMDHHPSTETANTMAQGPNPTVHTADLKDPSRSPLNTTITGKTEAILMDLDHLDMVAHHIASLGLDPQLTNTTANHNTIDNKYNNLTVDQSLHM